MEVHDTVGRLHVSASQAKAYRSRREALFAAVTDLTTELDAISALDTADVERLERALLAARRTLAQHVAESEADDGILEQVVTDEPNLSARVQSMLNEHGQLTAEINALIDAVASTPNVDQLVRDARMLTARLDGHRHRATELLLDAYMLDLSAGD